ncbi:hypothetical protein H5410_027016 [Solanum commersonii]|uniref:Uncharacterized protein n=1 Tax=Solanum commersonii TaxID=4109 RepID=A0A9J5Z292_SOLCO|nr:hypothetical protein H5410_027016 [Solanum commersonii]
MQVQAQQRYSNALTTKMIPYSHTIFQHFRVPKSHTTLTLTNLNTCMTSPIGLPLFSIQHSFQLTQDHKGLFNTCNGAECKERSQLFKFLPRKRIRLKRVQARFTHLTRLATNEVYCQIVSLFKIVA